jgi:hypothetical protein
VAPTPKPTSLTTSGSFTTQLPQTRVLHHLDPRIIALNAYWIKARFRHDDAVPVRFEYCPGPKERDARFRDLRVATVEWVIHSVPVAIHLVHPNVDQSRHQSSSAWRFQRV